MLQRRYEVVPLVEGIAFWQDGEVYIRYISLFGFENEMGTEPLSLCIRPRDHSLWVARLTNGWRVTGPIVQPVLTQELLGHKDTHLKVSQVAFDALEWYKEHPLTPPGWEKRALPRVLMVALGSILYALFVYFLLAPISLKLNGVYILYILTGLHIGILWNSFDKLKAAKLNDQISEALTLVLGWILIVGIWGIIIYPFLMADIGKILN